MDNCPGHDSRLAPVYTGTLTNETLANDLRELLPRCEPFF